ncbi:MAG: hypothetical protein KatS3mg081_2739 [Gemmatimonadales bacterium]|nr:MAG: hypothetical protein KatS3mg081_2739 [Gemmatimonadales bacterium]
MGSLGQLRQRNGTQLPPRSRQRARCGGAPLPTEGRGKGEPRQRDRPRVQRPARWSLRSRISGTEQAATTHPPPRPYRSLSASQALPRGHRGSKPNRAPPRPPCPPPRSGVSPHRPRESPAPTYPPPPPRARSRTPRAPPPAANPKNPKEANRSPREAPKRATPAWSGTGDSERGAGTTDPTATTPAWRTREPPGYRPPGPRSAAMLDS